MGGIRKSLAAVCACALAFACFGQPPRRVASVSEATTHVARAMGLGDRIQMFDPADPKALEHALTSRANLVISDASPATASIRAAFSSRGIPVRVFSPTSTNDALTAYTEIATVLGKPRAAAAFIEKVTRALEALAKPGAKQSVALVVSRSPLRVVTGDAFLSRLLASAGAQNVFVHDDGVVITIRKEQLDAAKPDRTIDVAPDAIAQAWLDPLETAKQVLAARP
ncbi:MAG TPA: ABC transporter substrate-binding protein [Casimicrobiaceae bacterium]|nr:ABC transporter substrate-binding protein [Myxococcota bacterium]HTS23017.1 ABC transporter substrate-binding protein [Casimicrobiaceae bacterium]